MSVPAPPPDRSVELRQLELDASERQRLRQAEEDQRLRTELAGLRSDARTGAQGNAQQYFAQQGLVPGDYATDIDAEINRILSSVPRDDPNPGSYFSNVGPSAYSTAQTGQRNVAQRDLDRIFAPNFETARVPYTLDDPILAGIEAEQRGSADDIIRNMLTRGVITPTGYEAGRADLERQTPGVRAQLNEIGTGQLATGQQALRDIANRARSTASQINLGAPFDPYSFGSEADAAFTNFMNNLGMNIRAAAPGNLFRTSGLGAIAGAGQGAQNTAFDPKALAGIIAEQEQPRTGTSTVF
jgi:hypothetical protein